MNGKEGVDMAKMSVGCLLLTLLIGTTMGLWYFSQNSANKTIYQMEEATNSARSDRLWKLDEHCKVEGSITVPTAVSALTEFADGDLLYIRVVDTDSGFDTLYVPQGISSTVTFASTNGSTPNIEDTEMRYVNNACRKLLQYSDSNCILTVCYADSDAQLTNNSADGKMLGVTVEIIK